MNKIFSQEDCDEYDPKARAAAKRIIEANFPEWEVVENGPKEVDLTVRDHKTKKPLFYVECGVKTGWNTFNWPRAFRTVHIEDRKFKYFDLDLPTSFCIFNTLYNNACFVAGKDVKVAEMVDVPNRINAHELFYDVPIDKAEFFS